MKNPQKGLKFFPFFLFQICESEIAKKKFIEDTQKKFLLQMCVHADH